MTTLPPLTCGHEPYDGLSHDADVMTGDDLLAGPPAPRQAPRRYLPGVRGVDDRPRRSRRAPAGRGATTGRALRSLERRSAERAADVRPGRPPARPGRPAELTKGALRPSDRRRPRWDVVCPSNRRDVSHGPLPYRHLRHQEPHAPPQPERERSEAASEPPGRVCHRSFSEGGATPKHPPPTTVPPNFSLPAETAPPPGRGQAGFPPAL